MEAQTIYDAIKKDSLTLIEENFSIAPNLDGGLTITCKTCGKKRSFKTWGYALNNAVYKMYDDVMDNHDGRTKYPRATRSVIRDYIANL